MVSSLSINNNPMPWHDAGAARASAPKSEDIRHQPERLPRVLDVEGSRLMERRLAQRAQQHYRRDDLAACNRKAIDAYRSLASTEERDVVSEVLGIDVYA